MIGLMVNARPAVVHAIASLLLGGAIYLLWRSPSMLMFRWVELIGLSSLLEQIRSVVEPCQRSIPRWVLFSLPDGLWVFALTVCMRSIWRNSKHWCRFAWIGLGPLVGVGGEFAQACRLIPGTFDLVDLVACSFTSILALTV